MISDNGGKSWYIGGNVTDWNLQYPNENQAVSLGGSNVFVNARTMLTDRIGALSKDGAKHFTVYYCASLPTYSHDCHERESKPHS